MIARLYTSTGALARMGYTEPVSALRLAESEVLAGLLDIDADSTGLFRAIAHTADPDKALLGLVRLLEAGAATEQSGHSSSAGSGAGAPGGSRGGCGMAELRGLLSYHCPQRDRVIGVLGASSALADHLVAHPAHWRAAAYAEPRSAASRAQALVAAVGPENRAHPDHCVQGRDPLTGYDWLRVSYREQMLGIAALDVTSEDPTRTLPATAAALADLAGAALEAALAIANEENPEAAALARIAVMGMGKTGGGELNYISDVDVIFVVEPAAGAAEDDAVAAGTKLATELIRACSQATGEGSLWQVDPALRPEGKQGPLVRTVASHRQYYQRWAKTWEFQALLKARFVAGDAEVGQAYLDAMRPMVWEAASRDHFVEDVQAMRRRVEQHVPSAEAKRQLKLGPGGLRDVEFSVQLLQLVHGRADESLRSRNTLEALDALAAGGYVGRDAASTLDAAYRFLRTLEHRIQLQRMRRTHLMPTSTADLRRLGRGLGHRTDPDKEIVARWQAQAREVRQIHEMLFYRPLLAAAARLSTDDTRLTEDAARARLHALGFRDPAGAMRHLAALTSGYDRTSAMLRTLLPIMLGWFADEADPDAGLLSFRRVSESLGSIHWYLKMLRDSGHAAERLAHVLGRSRYAAELLERSPESVRLFADDEELTPRTREQLLTTLRSAVGRKNDATEALGAVRSLRRQELFRIAVADLVGVIDLDGVGVALTDLTEAVLELALYITAKRVGIERGLQEPPTDLAVIGMGRLGGRECGYASDADVMVVHRPRAGAEEGEAQAFAVAVVQELRRELGAAGPDPALDLDCDLRPEGKAGPLARTLEGYRAYYDRWAAPWESQALVRARPVAGDPELGAEFVALIDPIRWHDDGVPAASLKEIRKLKARMESERLPRGADPKLHVKMGPGGLSDIEWTIQLLQMNHAAGHPELRTAQTLPALTAALDLGLIDADDAAQLRLAWRLSSGLRNANLLFKGRASDNVPRDTRDADGVARILGYDAGSATALGEDYRRTARKARSITERLFYGRDEARGASG